MRLIKPALALLAVIATGCSLDLSVPEGPQRGGVSGVVDTQGFIAAEGLEVALVAEDSSRSTATTDATGAFVFGDAAPGLYYLDLTVPGFAPMVRPGLRVRAGQTLDAGRLAPTWLQGTEAEATVIGTAVTSDGADLKGGQVEFILEKVSKKLAVAPILAGGEFVQRVPPGRYTLRATHPLFVSAELAGVEVAPASVQDLSASPLVLGLNPATLTGTVLRERDGQAPVPAQGALVTLDNGVTTTSDASGNFQVGGLAGGARTVRVGLAGHRDPEGLHSVTLEPGKSAALPSVTLMLNRGSIGGMVELADQQAARDITVAVTGTGYTAGVAPDATEPWKGRFLLQNVPEGTYEVSATKARYSRAVIGSVNVTAAGTDVGTLTLTVLQGDFVIDDGDPANTAGYTRTPQVTLSLTGLTSAAKLRLSEDPAFTGVPFTAFTGTTQPFTLSNTQGTHTVYAQYEDASGTPSPVFSSPIVLDSVAPAAPSIAINGGAAFTKVAQPLSLTLQAQEVPASGVDAVSGLASVRLSEDGTPDAQGNLTAPRQPFQRDMLFVRPATADGVQVVYVQFVDHAGNASAIVNAQIVVDTGAPTGSVAIVKGAKATANGFTNVALVDVTEQVGVEPNGGFVLVKLANTQAELATAVLQPVRAISAWFLDPSQDGQKTLYAQLQDAAGNVSGQLTATIIYDTTSPSPATATLVGPSPVSGTAVTLAVSASDTNGLSPTAALTVSEDPYFLSPGTVGPGAMPGAGQVAFTLRDGDGPRQVLVRFRDVAGNDATASVPVTLDTQAPTGNITVSGTLADGTASGELTATSSVTVTLNHAGATGYLLGNETLTACPASGYTAITTTSISHTLSGTASPRQVRMCLRDAAGNRAGPLVASITLDPAAPTGCALALAGSNLDGSAAPAGKTALRAVTASVSGCAEAPKEIYLTTGAVTCSAAGALFWQPFSAAPGVTLVGADGANAVNGCVRDAARNVAALPAASITLDTAPPSPATATLVGSPVRSAGPVTITLAASDTNGLSPAAAVTASEDPFFAGAGTVGPMAFPVASQLSFPLSAGDGLKTVYVRFKDSVGNSAVAQVRVTVDSQAPSGSIAVRGTLADGTVSTTFTSTPNVTVLLTQSGAVEYLLGNETLASCPASGYTAIASGSIAHVLTGSASPRQVRACLRDAAGNTVGPAGLLTAAISLDAVTPAGCAVALAGKMADGVTNAPAGKSATPHVTATVGSCLEIPTELVLSPAPIASCAPGAPLAWQPFNASQVVTLSGPDGANTIYGCVRDAARNSAAVTFGTITLDTTPPLAPALLLDSGAAWVNGAQVVLLGGYKASAAGTATGATEWALSETTTFGSFQSYATGNPSTFTFSGGGPRILHAIFRDEVGNLSAVASDSIEFDIAPPSVAPAEAALNVVSPTSNAYTNDAAVVVELTAPSDAVLMKLAQAASAASCVAGDMSSAVARPMTGTSLFLFTPGDEDKRLCVTLLDAAGNESGFVPSPLPNRAMLTLDTLPPSVPIILTQATTLKVANGTPFPITTAPGGVTEAHFSRYQRLGGLKPVTLFPQNTWVDDSSVQTATSFSYLLRADAADEDGVPNVLRLRAIDLAGNVGPEASVTITNDIKAPNRPTMNIGWVDNGAHKATVFWQAPAAATDVTGYNLYYGSSAATYNGSFANEGLSPIFVASGTSFTLSGLTNAAPTFVQVKAVDAAGNESLAPLVPEVTLEPNEVSPNLVATLTVPNLQLATRLAVSGDFLYVSGNTFNCFSGTGSSLLRAIDLRSLVSPVQGGKVVPSPAGPTLAGSLSYPDQVSCATFVPSADLVVDGPYAFQTAGARLRIYSLAIPGQPALVTSIDLSAVVAGFKGQSVSLVGDKLFLNGRTAVIALDLAKLYDGNPATLPSSADVTGTVSNGNLSAASALLTRDRFLQLPTNGYAHTWDIARAIDNDPFTVWDNAARFPTTFGVDNTFTPQVASGNLLYLSGASFSVFRLDRVWSAGALDTTDLSRRFTTGAGGQFDVVGGQVFLGDRTSQGVRSLDLSEPTTRDTGFNSVGGQPDATLTYGNYLISAVGGTLRFYEIATPRALSLRASVAGTGAVNELSGAFLYGGGGVAVDLQSSWPPVKLTTTFADCAYDAARFGDTLVEAVGNGFTVVDMEKQVDRSGTFSAADKTSVPIAAGRITGVEAYGNYLVAAEVRGDGVWLEVFDATKLRDRLPTQLSASDSLGAFRVNAAAITPSANLWAQVSVNAGRALVTLDDSTASSPNPGVYLVDLRPLFDDDSSTVVTAAHRQGAINLIRARGAVRRGDYAYVATFNSLVVVDVKEAMDEDLGTVVPLAATRTTLSIGNPEEVAVYGSYAYLSPAQGGSGALRTLDVSSPLAPTLLGYYPYGSLGSTSCTPALDSASRMMRAGLSVGGSRLYYTHGTVLSVFEVE